MTQFSNDDAVLFARVDQAREERERAGRKGLTGGLDSVILNVEPASRDAAAAELLRYTGMRFSSAFVDQNGETLVFTLPGSATFLMRTRIDGNPFTAFNMGPKSAHRPNARLETFVYRCSDLERYKALQEERGVRFMNGVTRGRNYLFAQTEPSPFTGNSTGLIQWLGKPGDYSTEGAQDLGLSAHPALAKPDLKHLANIGRLDHSATRVRAEERDSAIVEFMGLTDYDFDFAVYVESLNSITNVARLTDGEYAQVFTSGIKPFTTFEESGPTERFIHNYGLRVHHLAFDTKDIEATYQALANDGMEFLVELVGGPDEGLHQTFSRMSEHTFLVNEYIRRYGGFDGFFTRSNVTELTRATDKQ